MRLFSLVILSLIIFFHLACYNLYLNLIERKSCIKKNLSNFVSFNACFAQEYDKANITQEFIK